MISLFNNETIGENVPHILTIDDYDFKGKTALVRVDFNSPIDPKTKKVLDSTRIKAHGESTIRELSAKGAKVVVLAHQGRPGDPDFTSLREHAKILGTILGKPVQFVDDLLGEKAQKAIQRLKNGEILVLDNVRSFADRTGEEAGSFGRRVCERRFCRSASRPRVYCWVHCSLA
jgi:phosphoglycerate kinase